MGFKQSPFPMITGTKGHSSALKKMTAKEAAIRFAKGEGGGAVQEAFDKETKKEVAKTVKKTGKKTYKQAYMGLSAGEKKKHGSYEAFAKKAREYNIKKYGTTEPTRESKKLIGKHKGDMLTASKVTKKDAKRELAARTQKGKEDIAKIKADFEQSKADIKAGKAKVIKSKDRKGGGKGPAVDYRKEQKGPDLSTREGRKTAKKALKRGKDAGLSKEAYKASKKKIKTAAKESRKAWRKGVVSKISKALSGKKKAEKREADSPLTNYRNPQEYEVFNWGNKPTPFEKRKKY